MGRFLAIPQNECPCSRYNTSGCDNLPECTYSMAVNDLCEADQALPDGNENYSVDNCPPRNDVFRFVTGKPFFGKKRYNRAYAQISDTY